MATLTGTKVKDTYQSLIKLESGTLSSTYKTVEDGSGNDSGLKISTSGVEVGALKFTSDPSSSSSELTALVYDGSTKEVKVRDLSSAAFSGALSSSILVVGLGSDFTIETSFSAPTPAAVDNDAENASYQFGATADLTLDTTNKKVIIEADGVYRIKLSAKVVSQASRDIFYKILKGSTVIHEIERAKDGGGTYLDHIEHVSYFRATDEIKVEYKASGDGCDLKAGSYYEIEQLF